MVKYIQQVFHFLKNFRGKYGDLSLGIAAKGALRRGRNEAKIYGSLEYP